MSELRCDIVQSPEEFLGANGQVLLIIYMLLGVKNTQVSIHHPCALQGDEKPPKSENFQFLKIQRPSALPFSQTVKLNFSL